MNKNIAIAVLVVSTLLFAVLYIGSQVQLTRQVAPVVTYGATTLFTNELEFANTITFSGEIQAKRIVSGGNELSMASSSSRFSTSTGTYTITAADVCNNNIISVEDWAGQASSTTRVILPSVTALFADCLGSLGKSFELLFRNEASAAASTTLIVAGTNIVLTSSTPSGVVIPGGASAKIEMWRLNVTATSSGVQANVSVQTDAD